MIHWQWTVGRESVREIVENPFMYLRNVKIWDLLILTNYTQCCNHFLSLGFHNVGFLKVYFERFMYYWYTFTEFLILPSYATYVLVPVTLTWFTCCELIVVSLIWKCFGNVCNMFWNSFLLYYIYKG